MPKITALLHAHNDAIRLGRALESLRPCDELLIIDDGSEDGTERVAREHGAIVKTAIPGVSQGAYAMDASYEWIFCIRPNESLSEVLEAALFEWKNQEPSADIPAYQVSIREQKEDGWHACVPEVRLVNRSLVNWVGELPPNQGCDSRLAGDLLCFHQP